MDLHWKSLGACVPYGPEMWFSYQPTEQDEARRICVNECPVQHECLEYALARREDDGIWGGHSERSRRRILKERRAAATAIPTSSTPVAIGLR